MNNVSTPRAVLLDAAGTLIDIARPLGDTYSRLARDFGGDLDPDTLTAGFRTAFSDTPPMAFPAGAARTSIAPSEAGGARSLPRVTGAAGGVPDFTPTSIDCMPTTRVRRPGGSSPRFPPCSRPCASGAPSSRWSRTSTRALCRCSTRWDSHRSSTRWCARVRPVPRSRTARSSPMRSATLGVERSQALHVGDSREADYEGALAAGIEALLVDRSAARSDGRIITDLRGILDHVA